MGTNVDCYQRAEGRYRLMPGIIAALRDARNPFSILTKGTLLLRDLDLLDDASQVTSVALNMSVGFADADLSASVEPGTPSPQRRLEACAKVTERGMRCGILMGPVLPFLTDSPGQLAETVRQAADAGAASVTPIVLHLRPGAREWYLAWLSREHPSLVPRYRELYGSGAYAPKDYQRRISARVGELAARYGVGSASPASARRVSPARSEPPGQSPAQDKHGLPACPATPDGVQLSLL
jgi:DNA repair photolyase